MAGRVKMGQSDGGLDANNIANINEFVAKCRFCKTGFQCRVQNMKVHEHGKQASTRGQYGMERTSGTGSMQVSGWHS